MLRKAFYPKIESYLNQLAARLKDYGFSPNQLTLGGLALNFAAGWVYASGHLFWGGIFLILAALGDMLDGPLARITGRTTKFGAFLDSTADRYSDFFVSAGLGVHYARTNQEVPLLLIFGIILGSFVISYAKARAENLIPDCSVGIFERSERVIAFALGSVFSPLMPFVLWVLLIGTHITAIHRILYTRKALKGLS